MEKTENKRFYIPGTFPTWCACGRVYQEREWVLLRFRGIQIGIHEGYRYNHDLEVRDCLCKSTLAVRLVSPPIEKDWREELRKYGPRPEQEVRK